MQNTILSYLPNAFQNDIESVEILRESSWKAVIHTECDSSPFLSILDPFHLTTAKAMAIVWRLRMNIVRTVYIDDVLPLQ